MNELVEGGRERQLQQLRAAADREGASKLRHYVQQVRGLSLMPPALGQRQPYLEAVRRRQQREALAQLRTGSHWGAEETGRWRRQPREARLWGVDPTPGWSTTASAAGTACTPCMHPFLATLCSAWVF